MSVHDMVSKFCTWCMCDDVQAIGRTGIEILRFFEVLYIMKPLHLKREAVGFRCRLRCGYVYMRKERTFYFLWLLVEHTCKDVRFGNKGSVVTYSSHLSVPLPSSIHSAKPPCLMLPILRCPRLLEPPQRLAAGDATVGSYVPGTLLFSFSICVPHFCTSPHMTRTADHHLLLPTWTFIFYM